MANDNKISVDINIAGDGQKQIDQYTASFNSLRNSVNGLSQPLNSFSNDINTLDRYVSKYTESLNKLNAQHDETISTGEKVHNKVSEVSTSFSTGIGVLTLFNLELKALYVYM